MESAKLMPSIQVAVPATARRPSRVARTGLIVLCAIGAAAAMRRIVVLLAFGRQGSAGPPAMAALDTAFAARKALTLAHIVPALLLVALLPLWCSERVRAHGAAHRRITYALFALGLITGVTAAALSLHPFGGVNEASAALLYDGLFLFCLARAWILFRRNDWRLHRTWMVRGMAVLLGIAMTRPVMGVFFATQSITHLAPAQFFGTAFWIGFTTMYIAGEAYLRTHPA